LGRWKNNYMNVIVICTTRYIQSESSVFTPIFFSYIWSFSKHVTTFYYEGICCLAFQWVGVLPSDALLGSVCCLLMRCWDLCVALWWVVGSVCCLLMGCGISVFPSDGLLGCVCCLLMGCGISVFPSDMLLGSVCCLLIGFLQYKVRCFNTQLTTD
jgi:hypothetical protein